MTTRVIETCMFCVQGVGWSMWGDLMERRRVDERMECNLDLMEYIGGEEDLSIGRRDVLLWAM